MTSVAEYNASASEVNSACITAVFREFTRALPTATFKVWHGHPVWFLNEIPVAGYQDHQSGVKVLFWSGKDFNEPALTGIGKHRAAGITYPDISSINTDDLRRWLKLSTEIIWDYRSLRPAKL